MTIAEAEALYMEAERLQQIDHDAGRETSEITQAYCFLVLNRLQEAGAPAALIGADRLAVLRRWVCA